MDRSYLLPTTKEIAQIAFTEFHSLEFPPNAKKLLFGAAPNPPHYFKFLDVRRCVLGISPELAFEQYIIDAFPQEAFTEAEQIINSQAQHFFFYHAPRCYHLFNLLAVAQVARNYPQYFPEEAGTRGWLQDNWQLWADGRGLNCIRYGLLSGFPLEAVLAFCADKSTEGKYHAMSEKTHLSYCGVNPEDDRAYIQRLEEIFNSLSCG